MIGGLPTDKFITDDKEGSRNARSWTRWFNELAAVVRGLTTSIYGIVFPAGVTVTQLPLRNYPNDATASANGVPKGGLYHTAGTVKVCLI